GAARRRRRSGRHRRRAPGHRRRGARSAAGGPPGKQRGRTGVSTSARRSSELHLLRYVPTNSPVHRLWAGTKLLALFAFGVALSLKPNWHAEGILAATLVVAVLVARIPAG